MPDLNGHMAKARLPCDPYIYKVYDINEDRVIKAQVIGYDILLLEISILESRGIKNYFPVSDRHGIICSPYFEVGSSQPLEEKNAE
jgi:hypothetical protein